MLFSISDLHLSLTNDPQKVRKMSKFGEIWDEHHLKIKENWERVVKEDDTVLICGDVSWAMRLPDFENDAKYLMDLPGKKIITRGNHDYYFQSMEKMNKSYPGLFFLKNSMTEYTAPDGHAICICSIKGSLCENDSYFTKENVRLYKKETTRLKTILKRARGKGYKDILLALHYPVTNDLGEPSLYTELIKEYGVKTVVYGHLHNKECHDKARIGVIDGVNYILTSADYLNFCPVMIL